ncbi:MAG: YcaO-like family protein [Candidatus Baltobacteraceae bacterium]
MVDLLARRAPKAPGTFDRETALEGVLAKVPSLRKRYSIHRVGELTYLDRIGIPVVTAMVPKSEDALGVYNGKGRTRAEALVGAVMEACERQTAAAFHPPTRPVPLGEIQKHLDLHLLQRYESSGPALDCVQGVDLLSGARIDVPLALVAAPWRGTPTFPTTHTSGLASGSTILEAIYHALMELIERHIWSLTHVRAHVVPGMLGGEPPKFDLAAGERIEQPTTHPEVDRLCEQVRAAGLDLRLLLLREPDLPYMIHAAILEPSADCIEVACGIGASWSPAHAAIRAITEAAQSRLVDIQGAREDIVRRKRPRMQRWWAEGTSTTIVPFASLADHSSFDLADDLAKLLRSAQIIAPSVAMVELPAEDIAVVRVIVPEFESYLVDGRIGAVMRREVATLSERLASHR